MNADMESEIIALMDRDPTARTMETLHREIRILEDKTVAATCAAEKMNNERFRSIEKLQAQTEAQRVEQKQDTQKAVEAALAAQKEAVKEQTTASGLSIAKSEAATAEQLKQITSSFSQSLESMNRIVTDLKERLVTMESMKRGNSETVIDRRQEVSAQAAQRGNFIAVVSTTVAALAAIAALIGWVLVIIGK